MSKIYYGGGNCTIESPDANGVQIRYKGAIKIKDKTSDNYHIATGNNKIIIFPIGVVQPLSELFEYNGSFNIISVLVADSNGKKVSTTIKRVMDYAELIDSNAEDLTVNSERLRAGYSYGATVRKTSVDKNIIKSLHTSNHDGDLFTSDGSPYSGYYHIHPDGSAMSGKEHTEGSQYLYYKKIGNDKLFSNKRKV